MKCPYCEKEMAEGYLQNPNQPVQWIPEGSKPAFFIGCEAEGSVRFGGGSLWKWRGYTAKAHYCYRCKILLAKK